MTELVRNAKAAALRASTRIVVEDVADDGLSISLNVFFSRTISIARRHDDGEVIWEPIETIDQVLVRMFRGKKAIVLSAINPPRSSKYIETLMSEVVGQSGYFYEPLEINEATIKKHISKFEVTRLVSAKVKDFAVYEGAVGRFEVTSKHGLKDEIAPFLDGKYYRLDSLTYEVTHKFATFLIMYSSNGALKVNENYLDMLLPSFERLI
jgi:hypothetical protein